MPRLVRFVSGLIVSLHIPDHNPPHIHAENSGKEALIDIRTGEILEGDLDKKDFDEITSWLERYRDKVMKLWETKEYDKNDWK